MTLSDKTPNGEVSTAKPPSPSSEPPDALRATVAERRAPAERPPYFWEVNPPHVVRQLEAAALAWFDRETQRMREERRLERALRRRAKQGQGGEAGAEADRCRDCPGRSDLACGILDRCPSVAGEAMGAALESAEQARKRRRGERLARLIREHGTELRPVILDLIAPAIGELLAEVLQ